MLPTCLEVFARHCESLSLLEKGVECRTCLALTVWHPSFYIDHWVSLTVWGRACCISQDQHWEPQLARVHAVHHYHSMMRVMRSALGCARCPATSKSFIPIHSLVVTFNGGPMSMRHYDAASCGTCAPLLVISCTRPTSTMLPLANCRCVSLP